MATAFDYELGVSQGRIVPVNADVIDGSFLFVLGSDRLPAPEFDLAIGDKVELSQSIDLTAVEYIGASSRFRQPLDVPRRVDLPAGTILQHGMIFPSAELHTKATIGAGSAAVDYWADALGELTPAITIAYVSPVPDIPATTVAVLGNAITVSLRTSGAVVLADAVEVANVVNADLAASSLVNALAVDPVTPAVVTPTAPVSLLMGTDTSDAIITPTPFFTEAMAGRIVRITGSGAGNDGDKRIIGVRAEPAGVAFPSTTAFLGVDITSEGAGFSARLVGARWGLTSLVDGIALGTLIHEPGRDVLRTDLKIHVSKLVGFHTVALRLSLVEAD